MNHPIVTDDETMELLAYLYGCIEGNLFSGGRAGDDGRSATL